MKRNFLSAVITACALILPLSAYADTQTYSLDPGHSYVEFHIGHFGYSNPSGKWFANGILTLDKKSPANSKVDVTINIADVSTGIPKLDEHLKEADFFDAAKYPTATFVSNKVNVTGPFTADVHGTLNLHGVSKPVILVVKLNKAGVSPVSNKDTVGFSATTELKRSDFGIDKYLPGLSNEVDIDIEVEAINDTDKTQPQDTNTSDNKAPATAA